MKKLMLILGLIILTLIETKAQQEKQFIAADNSATLKISALPVGNLFEKKMYTHESDSSKKNYAYYNSTSRNLRIAGLSLLGAGLVLGVAGLLVVSNSNSMSDYGDLQRAESTHRALFISSAATGIISIPLMAMASAYKQKARLELKNQKTGFGVPANVSNDITGITFTIPIGK